MKIPEMGMTVEGLVDVNKRYSPYTGSFLGWGLM